MAGVIISQARSDAAKNEQYININWRKVTQSSQVGPFEAKYDKFGPLLKLRLLLAFEIFENLLSCWPFFKSTIF